MPTIASVNGTVGEGPQTGDQVVVIPANEKAKADAVALAKLAAADQKAALTLEKHSFARSSAKRAEEKHQWARAARTAKATLALASALEAEGGPDRVTLVGLVQEGHNLSKLGKGLRSAQSEVDAFLADWSK